jgi:chromate reductase, NAD(P)H dehydrogenase (quinone)
VVPTLLGVGPAGDAFDDDGAPIEPQIKHKVTQIVKELTLFSRGGA